MNNSVSQFCIPYIGLRNCETGSSRALLAMFDNKLYDLIVSAFRICLRYFLSLLLIKGSMVRKEALGRLDAETAVLSFLMEIKYD
jgi:hypothetical protein